MNDLEQQEAIRTLAGEDGRYHAEAYFFVRKGLDFTVREIVQAGGAARHVRGPELLGGLRNYAIREFGPMSFRVLQHWGVTTTDDIGEIVFHMIEGGILGKTEEDERGDFHAVFDFDDAFRAPFRADGFSEE